MPAEWYPRLGTKLYDRYNFSISSPFFTSILETRDQILLLANQINALVVVTKER